MRAKINFLGLFLKFKPTWIHSIAIASHFYALFPENLNPALNYYKHAQTKLCKSIKRSRLWRGIANKLILQLRAILSDCIIMAPFKLATPLRKVSNYSF